MDFNNRELLPDYLLNNILNFILLIKGFLDCGCTFGCIVVCLFRSDCMTQTTKYDDYSTTSLTSFYKVVGLSLRILQHKLPGNFGRRSSLQPLRKDILLSIIYKIRNARYIKNRVTELRWVHNIFVSTCQIFTYPYRHKVSLK